MPANSLLPHPRSLLCCLSALLLGCAGGGGKGTATTPREEPRAAMGGQPTRPPGRTDLDSLKQVVTSAPAAQGGNGVPSSPSGPAGPIDVADLRITPPADWRPVPPSSSMRAAQLEIPGQAGPGEAVVYFFGTGQGGGVEENAARWLGQITAGDAETPRGKARETLDLSGIRATIIRARGTYNVGPAMGGPGKPMPGWALVGLVFESPGGPVFVKIVGPAATIDAAEAAIDALVRSVRLAG